MHPPSVSAVLLPVLLAPLPTLAMLHCENLLIDGYKFNLEKLKGPHSVVTSKYDSMTHTYHNTTYTLDICGPLKKSGKSKSKEECPNGTRVCAIQRLIQGDTDVVETVTAISGALEKVGGSQFEYEATRLNGSDSNSDAHKEGLRLVLKGGKHPLDAPVKERRDQKAIVEFLCDAKEGTEGEWEDSEDKYSQEKLRRRDDKRDDGKKGDDDNGQDKSFPEHQLKKEDAALIWESYGPEKDADVLRLTWHTKYACEKRDGNGDDKNKGDDGGDASTHWGFFTWFVVLVFLGIASYLIFGSWLNYNRYGARGWDLVPHGDTIRDIPYLFKDWVRRVLNTVQDNDREEGFKTSFRDAALPNPDPGADSPSAAMVAEHAPYMVATYARPPPVFVQGEGSWLWDVENRKYLDFTAGIAVTSLGHGDAEFTRLLAQQANTLVHASNLYYNPWTGALSKLLVEKTIESGGMHDASAVFVCNSGSEANEAAIKFARKTGKVLDPTGRKTEIVSFSNAFHGRTMGSLSATHNPKYQAPFAPMVPGFRQGPYNDVAGLGALVTDATCGVIVEPIQGEGGVVAASDDFLVALARRCREVGSVLIYDEI
ncbi:hypothetical protein E4U41_006712, partial [Claviceps citrina]